MASQNIGIRIPPRGVAHDEVRKTFQQIVRRLGPASTPLYDSITVTTDLTLSALTATRLMQTNASKVASSVANLASWIGGTSNRVTVSDDGDGTVTLSGPQDIHTSASPQFTGIEVGAASDTTLTRASAGDLNVEGNILYRAGGTDVPVIDGGTGVSTLTDGGILLGSGTGAITALGVATNGQIPIGDGATDPVLATITGTSNRVTVSNGAGSITLSGPQDIHSGASPTFAGLDLTEGNITNVGDIALDSLTADGANLAVKSDTFWDDNTGIVIGHTAQIDFGATPEFQILGTAVSDSSMGFAAFSSTASVAPDFRFLKSLGTTIGSNVLVADGNRLGRIRFQGADGGDFNTTAAEFLVEVDGTASLNDIPGRFVFRTRTAGGSLSDKVIIDNAGFVGIGVDPLKDLHISSSVPTIRLSDSNATTDQEVATLIEFYRGDSTNRVGFLGMGSGSNDVLVIGTDYAAGEIRFATGSNSFAMAIDSSQNVGVGTTTPRGLFNVHAAAGSQSNISLSDGDVGHGFTSVVDDEIYLRLEAIGVTTGGALISSFSDTDQTAMMIRAFIGSTNPTDTTPAMQFRAGKLSGTSIGALADAETAFQFSAYNGGTDFLTILGNGSVGIGTASPDSLVEISSSDDARLKITDTGDSSELVLRSDGSSTQFFTNTNHDINIYTNGNVNQLFLDQGTGNVGINTITPAELLEIEDDTTLTVLQISNSAVAGDPVLAFALSGTKTFTMGVDDGDGDKFKIGTTAIGTNTALTIDSSQQIGLGTTSPGDTVEIKNSTNHAVQIGRGVTSGGPTDADAFGPSIILSRDSNGAFVHKIYTYDTVGNALNNMAYDSRSDHVFLGNDAEIIRFKENGQVGIGTTSPSLNADLTLEGGAIALKETTTPTADTNYGKFYTKTDNKAYFQDGAGVEHELAFV